ncbi:MAG: hypothetical protein Q8O67_07585 [Deltaproteobacteria bacterium]|nr:hypothetical protein [Deltaproteobacteria bacterium]
MTLASVHGAVPPAAVLCLGGRLAALVGGKDHLAPERIVVDDGGGVTLHPGPVGPRWLAPELRASSGTHATTADLWGLGRLLLELALGHPVQDNVADHADEARLKSLVDIDGHLLQPRLVDVLMALLASSPEHRLQSPVAAARVFATAEKEFGDGETELIEVVKRSRAPQDSGPSPTIAMASADVLSQIELVRLAKEAAEERRRQQAFRKTEATKDMPAKAILSEQELERIGQSSAQRQLPTQIVRNKQLPARGGTGSGDLVVDAELVPETTKPMLMLSAPEAEASAAPPAAPTVVMAAAAAGPQPTVMMEAAPAAALPAPTVPTNPRVMEENTRPIIAEVSAPHSMGDFKSMPDVTGSEPGEDAMARAAVHAAERKRTMMLVGGAVVLIVLVVVAMVALTGPPDAKTPETPPATPAAAAPADG